MKNKKRMITILSLGLVAVLAIAGTLAYLTSQKDKTNRFTIAGNGTTDIGTDIKLAETLFDGLDKDGGIVTADTDPGLGKNRAVDAFPGREIPKDPTIYVEKGPAYIRFELTFTDAAGNPIINEVKINEIIGMVDAFNPDFTKSAIDPVTGAVYFTKADAVAADPLTGYKLFSSVTIPSKWDNDYVKTFGDFNIVVTGQAIQEEGFVTAGDAFTAFDKQINPLP
ncbi:MAG: SipW-dependent-type signal peptide-containing protein [Eubacteriaceae bacterium]